MNRSRSNQSALFGLWRMTRVYSVYASGASPIGAPGWPEFAFCTASIESVRIVLMHSSSSSVFPSLTSNSVISAIWPEHSRNPHSSNERSCERGSPEQHPVSPVFLHRNVAHRGDRVRERDELDLGRPQRGHRPPCALVRRVDRPQPEPRREHTVERRRGPAARYV